MSSTEAFTNASEVDGGDQSSSQDTNESHESTASAADSSAQVALAVSHVTHWYDLQKKKKKKRKPNKHYRNEEADIQDRPALKDVSLSVNKGEIFGVLGPNGGGKTTLFRIISTLMFPGKREGQPSSETQAADVTIFGQSIFKNPEAARFRMGVVFQSPSIDGQLTARENLRHQGHLYGIQGKDLEDRIDHWLNYFGLADRADDNVDGFSGGMRRRVELSKSLLHEPGLLLLDEASTGLDPGGRADMWSQIERLREDKQVTVVMTTHLMEEADRCDRLAILNKGELVTCGEPAALKAQIGGEVIQLRLRGNDIENKAAKEDLLKEITETYGPWEDNQRPSWMAGTLRFEKSDGARIIGELAEKYGDRVESLSIGQPNLEDVFLHMTGHTLWEEQAK